MAQTLLNGKQVRDGTIDAAKLSSSVQTTLTSVADKVNSVDLFDVNDKIKTSLLPESVLGAMKFQGTWDALLGPALQAAAPENLGHYYIVSVAGTIELNGISEWAVGDWVVSNGSSWDKIDNSEMAETAATTSYANATSGLAATNVQAAIDEIAADLGDYATAASLSAEVTAREAADFILQGNIDAEATARAAADLVLQGNIDAEATTREAADLAINTALQTDVLRFDKYVRTAPSGTKDGVNAVFTLPSTAKNTETIEVYLNGILQEPTEDYTVTTTAITFVSIIPESTDRITVKYFAA